MYIYIYTYINTHTYIYVYIKTSIRIHHFPHKTYDHFPQQIPWPRPYMAYGKVLFRRLALEMSRAELWIETMDCGT